VLAAVERGVKQLTPEALDGKVRPSFQRFAANAANPR
jgi:hypothetical protein